MGVRNKMRSTAGLTPQILNPSHHFSNLTHDWVHEVDNLATLILNPVVWWAVPRASDAHRCVWTWDPTAHQCDTDNNVSECCDKEKGLLSVARPRCDLEECWKENNFGFQPVVTQMSWASKSFYPSHMWLYAWIHVTMCHTVPTRTNTFLLSSCTFHVLQCQARLSQERTMPVYCLNDQQSCFRTHNPSRPPVTLKKKKKKVVTSTLTSK